MSWNYRVVRKTYGDEESLSIREVYYDDDGSIKGYSKEPTNVVSETSDGLRWQLTKMLEALDKPILDDE